MAVYEGARQRPGLALPGFLRPNPAPARRAARPVERATTPRARGRSTAATRARPSRVGLRGSATSRVGFVLGAIVIVFSGAFLSLSQSVRVAAQSYDIVRLTSEQDRLEALSLDLRSDLDRLGGELAIRKAALDQGLGQLGAPIVIPAR